MSLLLEGKGRTVSKSDSVLGEFDHGISNRGYIELSCDACGVVTMHEPLKLLGVGRPL